MKQTSAQYLLVTEDYPPGMGGIARLLSELKIHFKSGALKIMAPFSAKGKKENDVIRLPWDKNAGWFERMIQAVIWQKEIVVWIFKNPRGKVILGQVFPFGPALLIARFLTGRRFWCFAYASEIPTPACSFYHRLIARMVYRSSESVLCISSYTESRIRSLAPKAQCQRVRLGVDSHVFKPHPPKAQLLERWGLQGKKVLLCLGRLVKRKGYDTAIKAMPLILAQQKDVVLVIAGDGPDADELRKLAHAQKAADHVKFVGILDLHELCDYYNLCDLFLFLARDERGDAEGFGLVVLEAWACRKPVIAGRSGSLPELIREGETGLLADPENSEDAAGKIVDLLNREEDLKLMAERGFQEAQKRTWELLAEDIDQYTRAGAE